MLESNIKEGQNVHYNNLFRMNFCILIINSFNLYIKSDDILRT